MWCKTCWSVWWSLSQSKRVQRNFAAGCLPVFWWISAAHCPSPAWPLLPPGLVFAPVPVWSKWKQVRMKSMLWSVCNVRKNVYSGQWVASAKWCKLFLEIDHCHLSSLWLARWYTPVSAGIPWTAAFSPRWPAFVSKVVFAHCEGKWKVPVNLLVFIETLGNLLDCNTASWISLAWTFVAQSNFWISSVWGYLQRYNC